MRTYCDVPTPTNISSSLYNVHEPANGAVYTMSRSDHVPAAPPINNHHVMQQRLNQRFSTNVTSQSESNLPNLHNYSPNNFRQYNRLGECAKKWLKQEKNLVSSQILTARVVQTNRYYHRRLETEIITLHIYCQRKQNDPTSV